MSNDIEKATREVVVVLGANRSGTSLLMQILVKLGLQASKRLVPANFSNTEGFYEDTDIVEVQTKLYACLNTPSYLPLPENWVGNECVKIAKYKLIQVMVRNLEETNGIFGFKDPRTSNFLPLWMHIFNNLSLVPKFILSVREPQNMISSFTRQYDSTYYMAELIWLLRTIEAIENTAGDCFIAHYEDWFADPKPFAQGLLRYTGLDQNFKNNLSAVLATTVKSNLNRASMNDYKIQNYNIQKLYAALMECRGADFDREGLMAVVKECRQAMEGFKGWYLLAHQANKKLAETQTRLDKTAAEAAKVKTLETRIQELEKEKVQSGQLAAQVQKLQRQLDQLIALGTM